MRVFTVPAKYADQLEARIATAVDEIRMDQYRRAHRHEPIVPDFMIDEERKGNSFAVIGKASDRLASAVGRAMERTGNHASKRRRPA